MTKPQNDAGMSEAVKALMDYSPWDEEGIWVITSRQAIHETAGLVEHQEIIIRQLRTELASAREAVWNEAIEAVIIKAISGMPQIFSEIYSDKIRALKPKEPKL